jgi:hypothetical protein
LIDFIARQFFERLGKFLVGGVVAQDGLDRRNLRRPVDALVIIALVVGDLDRRRPCRAVRRFVRSKW